MHSVCRSPRPLGLHWDGHEGAGKCLSRPLMSHCLSVHRTCRAGRARQVPPCIFFAPFSGSVSLSTWNNYFLLPCLVFPTRLLSLEPRSPAQPPRDLSQHPAKGLTQGGFSVCSHLQKETPLVNRHHKLKFHPFPATTSDLKFPGKL